MTQNDSNIIILKPTPSFLSFINEQLPNYELPDIAALQIDNTAYTIRKQENDEATLDEIERLFPSMFQHEISRLLGEKLALDVKGSFLDFLCCFKFELHSQVVLMESSFDEGHQLLCVKPRSVALKWIPAETGQEVDATNLLCQANLPSHIENATVVVKNFRQLSEIKPFIQHYYQPIFYAEMFRMPQQAAFWPVVNSFQAFRRYFEIEIHTQLVHLH